MPVRSPQCKGRWCKDGPMVTTKCWWNTISMWWDREDQVSLLVLSSSCITAQFTIWDHDALWEIFTILDHDALWEVFADLMDDNYKGLLKSWNEVNSVIPAKHFAHELYKLVVFIRSWHSLVFDICVCQNEAFLTVCISQVQCFCGNDKVNLMATIQ